MVRAMISALAQECSALILVLLSVSKPYTGEFNVSVRYVRDLSRLLTLSLSS